MIPFFVGYAMLVWYAACRGRRQARGFAAAAAGTLVLVALAYAHYRVGIAYPNIYMPAFQVLLFPYTALVSSVGFFIAVLPRQIPGCCQACGYDLTDLVGTPAVCPECGNASAAEIARLYRPSGTARTDLRTSDLPWVSAIDQPVRDAQYQDQYRHRAHQDPPHDRKLSA